MADPLPSKTDVAAQLEELARVLREHPNLGEDARDQLAELAAEMSEALRTAALPEPERARLAGTLAHLLQAVREPHSGLFGQARDRAERAFAAAEAKAPVLAGLSRRLLDLLSDLGI
jgi:hypothetical protein